MGSLSRQSDEDAVEGAVAVVAGLAPPAAGAHAVEEVVGEAFVVDDEGGTPSFFFDGHLGVNTGVRFICRNAVALHQPLALKGFRAVGYPAIAFTTSDDPIMQAVEGSTYIAKYAGVVVTDAAEPWQLLPVLTTRQDIYIDPQKPVAVEPKLYAVGEVTETSPLLVTTNFSLSYYSVEGEVEASRVPAYILSVDTEGTSVLTAWASDKFNAETITQAMKKSGIEEKVSHKQVVIPGFVAVLSAGVEDESGWSVQIGPKEASGLPNFLKNQWKP